MNTKMCSIKSAKHERNTKINYFNYKTVRPFVYEQSVEYMTRGFCLLTLVQRFYFYLQPHFPVVNRTTNGILFNAFFPRRGGEGLSVRKSYLKK